MRQLLVLLSVAILAGLVLVNRGQIGQFWQLLGSVKWYVLILVVVVQLISFFANAKYYESFLALYGLKVRFTKLYKVSLALNFVNQIFPSGGISGTSFLSNQLLPEVPSGKSTLAQLARYGFTYIAFLLVLTVGFLMLFLAGPVDRIVVRLILLLILSIIIIGSVALILINNRGLVENLSRRVVRWLNTSARWLFKRHRLFTPDQLAVFLEDFYDGYQQLKLRPGRNLKPLGFALLGCVAEVMTIQVVFLAFGSVVNIGAIIAAYALANILSLLAFFTNGIGVYEGVMVGSLVALGVPLTLALSVVVVYRGFNLLVFMPVGFYYYRQALEKGL